MKNKLATFMLFGMLSTQLHATIWGVKELQMASQAATEHFNAFMGIALYNGITGIAVDLNAQKVAAKAKITYIEGGVVKIASYFCHEHTDEIDCH